MARVDVVVPCYRYARYLTGCVESILSQPADVRVLILDDCSPDETPEVAAGLAARDRRVEYRRHAQNRGHIATYNEGLLGWARAEYCLLISADDVLAPGALGRAVELLEAHPRVGFAHGREVRFSEQPPADAGTGSGAFRITSGLQFLTDACRDGGNLVHTPTVVARTRLQQKLGGYLPDLPHTGDMEMWMRFAAHADVGWVDATQAFYRVHGQNMHMKELGTMLLDLTQRVAAFETLFRQHGERIPVDQLRVLAARGLAREALWVAIRAFDGGDPATYRAALDLLRRDYLGYENWPECAHLHRRLRWREWVGSRVYCELRRAAAALRRGVHQRAPRN